MTTAEFTVHRSWESDRRSPLLWLLSHIRRNWIWIIGVFFGALANALLAGAPAVLAGMAFDRMLADSSNLAFLGVIAVLIAVTQIARGLLQVLRNFSAELIGQRLERDTRDEMYGSLMGKSMQFHDSHATGDLMARATNDVREINLMFNPGLNLVVGSASFLLVPIIAAPRINPLLVLAPLAYLLLYILETWRYLRELNPATSAVRQEFGDMNTTLAEAIDGVETVKGAAQEAPETDRFRRSLASWRTAFVWQGDVEAKFIHLLLLGLVQTAALALSLFLYQRGELSVGDYVLSGGEVPAMVLVEGIVRLLPGVLGNPESAVSESFREDLLEGPHYTRPPVFRGLEVPEVLRSGDHAAIDRWRRERAREVTAARRPDLLAPRRSAEGDKVR